MPEAAASSWLGEASWEVRGSNSYKYHVKTYSLQLNHQPFVQEIYDGVDGSWMWDVSWQQLEQVRLRAQGSSQALAPPTSGQH